MNFESILSINGGEALIKCGEGEPYRCKHLFDLFNGFITYQRIDLEYRRSYMLGLGSKIFIELGYWHE